MGQNTAADNFYTVLQNGPSALGAAKWPLKSMEFSKNVENDQL